MVDAPSNVRKARPGWSETLLTTPSAPFWNCTVFLVVAATPPLEEGNITGPGEVRSPCLRWKVVWLTHEIHYAAFCSRSIDPVTVSKRRTSATLHACAQHPRGVYGGSASKISLMLPMQAVARCCPRPTAMDRNSSFRSG